MGKKGSIEELTNLMSRALRHKIGSIVNKDEIYAVAYARDAETLMLEAKKVRDRQNLNRYDKEKIKELLRIKLKKELIKKDFLDDRKFEIMDDEIEKALKNLDL